MTTDPQIEALCREIVEENECIDGRVLPDGSIATLIRLITTVAICLGVTREGWSRRFCYSDPILAIKVFYSLETEDDEPEGWVARRPEQPCDWQLKR